MRRFSISAIALTIFLAASTLLSPTASAQVPPGPWFNPGNLGPICPGPGALCQPVPVPPAYVGPGDIATGWTVWYGLRAFSAATAGTRAIDIRRASDGLTCTVLTKTNGDLDVVTGTPCGGATTTAFCNATHCYISKFYDKVGTNDASDSTAGSQLELIFNCVAALPCAKQTQASGPTYTSVASLSGSQPWSMACETDLTANPSPDTVSCLTNSGNFYQISIYFGNNNDQVYAGSGLASGTSQLNVLSAITATGNGASSSLNTNGAVVTGNAGTQGLGALPAQVFNGTNATTVQYFEAGIAATSWTVPQRDNINTNMSAYW